MADIDNPMEVEKGAGDSAEQTFKVSETKEMVDDERITDTSSDDKTTEAASDDQTTEAASDDKTTEAASDDKITEAASDDQITEAASDDKITEAASDEKITEAASDDKITEAASDDQTTEAAVNKEPEFDDVLGSGALMKKIVKKGSGEKSRNGDKVTVRWSREIPSTGKTFPTEELTFTAGDGDVVQALDLIVVLVHVGDEVEVKVSHRFMHGEVGLPPDVPPNSDFHLHIEVVSNSGPVDYDVMDFNTRFNEAKTKKERGNFLFKRKEYGQAMSSYVKASKIVDPDSGCVFPDETPEKLQELLEFRAVVLCNTSVAQLRCVAYDAAVKSALEATKLSPSYSKAYYRLGQAYEKKGKFDQTIKAYKTALKYDPENSKVLHGELARLTKANRKAKETEQKMYSKMFWGDKPPSLVQTQVKDNNSLLSWMKSVGLTVVGAGVVGLTGIGLYKYMNH